MKNYVAGFMFDSAFRNLLLIRKETPAWQRGKYNAIGGKIEPNENPNEAMVREFREETGLVTSAEFAPQIPLRHNVWKPFVILTNGNNGRQVYFYRSYGDIYSASSVEKEKVEVLPLPLDKDLPVIPNLKWLVPLALDMDTQISNIKDVGL